MQARPPDCSPERWLNLIHDNFQLGSGAKFSPAGPRLATPMAFPPLHSMVSMAHTLLPAPKSHIILSFSPTPSQGETDTNQTFRTAPISASIERYGQGMRPSRLRVGIPLWDNLIPCIPGNSRRLAPLSRRSSLLKLSLGWLDAH